jgi:hypothetical protein
MHANSNRTTRRQLMHKSVSQAIAGETDLGQKRALLLMCHCSPAPANNANPLTTVTVQMLLLARYLHATR